jgi:hypothetical protein
MLKHHRFCLRKLRYPNKNTVKQSCQCVLGNRVIATCALNLVTRWKWIVSFMPRPLFPSGKKPLIPLGLGGLPLNFSCRQMSTKVCCFLWLWQDIFAHRRFILLLPCTYFVCVCVCVCVCVWRYRRRETLGTPSWHFEPNIWNIPLMEFVCYLENVSQRNVLLNISGGMIIQKNFSDERNCLRLSTVSCKLTTGLELDVKFVVIFILNTRWLSLTLLTSLL